MSYEEEDTYLTRESKIVTIKLPPQCPRDPSSEPTHAGPPPTPADARQSIEEEQDTCMSFEEEDTYLPT